MTLSTKEIQLADAAPLICSSQRAALMQLAVTIASCKADFYPPTLCSEPAGSLNQGSIIHHRCLH